MISAEKGRLTARTGKEIDYSGSTNEFNRRLQTTKTANRVDYDLKGSMERAAADANGKNHKRNNSSPHKMGKERKLAGVTGAPS